MTPQELRDLRRQTGMTQETFAVSLGLATRTLQRWELGKFPIPYTTGRLLTLLAEPRSPLTSFEDIIVRVMEERRWLSSTIGSKTQPPANGGDTDKRGATT